MDSTYSERDRRRTQRWLKQNHGLVTSPEAFDLLLRRLVARHRIALWCSPLAVAVLAILGWQLAEWIRTADSVAADRTYAIWSMGAYALFALAIVVRDWLAGRGERHIGQTLTQRVSRGTAVSVPMMLGRARMAFLVVTLVLQGALATALLAEGQGWFAKAFPLAFAVSCAFVVIGVRQAATRPTIALDPASLAIDERFRSQDAFSATLPLVFLVLVFTGSGAVKSGLRWLDLAWALSAVIICALRLWAELNPPWSAPTTPRRSFLAWALTWVRP
jgi:hypothetical protein